VVHARQERGIGGQGGQHLRGGRDLGGRGRRRGGRGGGLLGELEPGSEGLFGAFKPGRDGEPVPRRIDYEALARGTSPYDTILTCVGADPHSGNDLDRLEAEVRRRLDACAAAFDAPSAKSPRPPRA